MFVLSGCCPGDIIKTTDHLHLPHLLAKYRLSFSFHHFSAPSYCLLIASSAAGWARFVKCDLRRKRFRLAMYWLTGRVRCGLGLGAHQEWVQMFPVVWNSAGSLHQPAHCPRTIRWFLIPFNWARWRWTAGRGATGWDNPAQPSHSQQTHSQIPSIHQHWLANMQCGPGTQAGITAGQCQPVGSRWKWIYLSFQRSIHQSTKMICWGFEYF